MTRNPIIKLVHRQARELAHKLIDEAPDGYVVKVAEETRTDAQNRLMWPVIEDLRQQVPEVGMHTKDDVKLIFLNELKQECRFLPELDGHGMFPVGQRSSTLSKKQFSGLMELMFAYGARHGVLWSKGSRDAQEEMMR